MTDSTRHRPRRPAATTAFGLASVLAVLAGCASTPVAPGTEVAATPATATATASTAASAPAAAPHPHAYTETIHSVLVSDDGKHVVAIGSNHHYVFETTEDLVRALRSPVHAQISATFSPFHVAATGDVSGDVTLRLADDATDAQRDAAEALGLKRDADGHWASTTRLYGHRFTGWTYQVGLQKDALNRAYTVEVTSDQDVAARVGDSVATPIRIAADGVQLLYYAPLAPVVLPMLFLLSAHDH
jgi:hypothetical protein